MILDEAGVLAEFDDGLGDEIARIGGDFAANVLRSSAVAWWPISMP